MDALDFLSTLESNWSAAEALRPALVWDAETATWFLDIPAVEPEFGPELDWAE